MQKDTKTISARIPLEEAETLTKLARENGVSLSKMLAMMIHLGLILATETLKGEKL